ncbi:hypothetical protein OESDEN_18864 [Oesophagostomum dentatum]|uniref:Uncharacterized protein n=1 Tax=Oesophagostomum dentatum TaxID=61180 RepID=A0A0B1SDZ3_OESDE|nr:hypothetical protein OESDEN_18864 [Oesophagostomum dentatum]
MYLCPYCSFSSCYSPASVKDHIKTKHNMFDPVPVDVRDEYTELIQSTYDQCFVDDSAPFLNRLFLKQVCAAFNQNSTYLWNESSLDDLAS